MGKGFSNGRFPASDVLRLHKKPGTHGEFHVAAVFATKKGQDLPVRWKGFEIIDGDLDDVRFTDPTGVIVGLRAKGDAIKDETGFVIQTAICPKATQGCRPDSWSR